MTALGGTTMNQRGDSGQSSSELMTSQLLLLVESIEDCAVCRLDPGGYVLSWNIGAHRVKGYSADEIIGQHFSCFYPRADAERGLPTDHLHSATGGRHEHEGWRVRKGGFLFWARTILTALQDDAGELLGFWQVTHDYSAQRRLQTALHRVEVEADRLAMVASRTNNAVVITDAAGRIEWVNTSFTRISEYPLAEALGKKPGELLHGPCTDPATVVYMREHLAAGRGFNTEILNYTRSGRPYWLSIEVQPVHDESGRLINFVAIQADITERKRLEEERLRLLECERAAREEAEQASRLKDQFLAVLSHELRTPLNSIIGFAQLLRRGALTANAYTLALETIERNGKLQAQLIDDLLDVARILQNSFSISAQRIQVHTVACAAVDAVQVQAQARRIELGISIGKGVGWIEADPRRLQQAIWNLLTNAIKFTPAGGRIEVYVLARDGAIEITVRDTGIGIERQFLPHIFDRFRQADSTSTREYGGLGLGLAIVRHIIALHGGTVEADSPGPGLGATFTIRLPVI